MRPLTLLIGIVALAFWVSPPAYAQAKKKNYICGPNGVEICVKTCMGKAGGQPRKCNSWCSAQRNERCR
jgi:hypothetical protein